MRQAVLKGLNREYGGLGDGIGEFLIALKLAVIFARGQADTRARLLDTSGIDIGIDESRSHLLRPGEIARKYRYLSRSARECFLAVKRRQDIDIIGDPAAVTLGLHPVAQHAGGGGYEPLGIVAVLALLADVIVFEALFQGLRTRDT